MTGSSTTPPEVDRVAAAQAAVAARRARAVVKKDVAERRRTPLSVAEAAWSGGDPRSPESSMRVRELLTSIPGVGPLRADRAMAELGIAASKRVGGLGVRQRTRLRSWMRDRSTAARTGRLVVLAGPTAVGKGTVSRHIREQYPEVLLSVSATTRPPRPGEVEGEHYYFVSDADFDRMIDEGEFLEWATVHNASRYGTPRGPIDAALATGRSVLLEIDLQGARAVRASMPEALLVFLLPPTWEELVRRLIGRGTESSEEQARRLETAKVELAAVGEFDVEVVNDDVARAAAAVVAQLDAGTV
ncbi:guanylate kinase [Schumannella sp. 10F1B-5-1]|uniref:guanylate kinase n=1 Tax=Schumannella sp. 10F1B-5-1 TaxID=2590780 RepID=UPI0011307E23|nr:guanylate kinase [Schumannella sp. 10F1B-5-1]TPW71031.1 guanylate kinase [Schumannella sp. 10F1B-5-1]